MVTLKTIAFQGALGAYSEQAARALIPDARVLPCSTFEEVFETLGAGAAQFACIPIENSVAGRVADIHHLLPRYDIRIIAEHYAPIHHQLMAPLGATLKDIVEVHSHVHALGQCRTFIKKQGFKAIVHTDTAGAARDVARLADPTKAAIASRLAATFYGLQILIEDIEDADHNTTRFLVITMANTDTNALFPMPTPKEPCITSLFFTLRSVPASLYKAIGGFATNGINLTKIESYVTGKQFSIAQFYVDVEGHPESVAMQHALDELRYFSSEVRILGTYHASQFRRNSMYH